METKPTGQANNVEQKAAPGRALVDTVLALWLLFVGFCFWSPYLGLGISSAVTALPYAVVLVTCLVVLGLRAARPRGKDADS